MASGTEQAANVAAVHVGLAHVDSVRARRQRHVHAVVHNQRHATRRGHGFERASQGDELACAALLLAKLHGRDAPAQGRRHHVRKRARAGQAAVGNEVETPVARRPHAVSNFSRLRMSDSARR